MILLWGEVCAHWQCAGVLLDCMGVMNVTGAVNYWLIASPNEHALVPVEELHIST